MNDHTSLFPERLRQLRAAKSLTQSELADALGVSRNSIFFYEAGKRTPDIVVLKKMAEYFGVTCDYMIGALIDMSEGEWELGKSGLFYFCSFCNYPSLPREAEEWSFCPLCGAKMKEVKSDGKL